MSEKKKDKEFDSDRFVVTKEEILEFCDSVLEKWNKKPEENVEHVFAMNAVKTSVLWTDEDSLKAIWGEILKWAFEKLDKNEIPQTKEKFEQQTKKPQTLLEGSIEFWENHYKNKVNPENWLERYRNLAQEYADITDKIQKETIYSEYLGLYNVIKKEGGKIKKPEEEQRH